MQNNNILLVIDPQNDFCNAQGALYVPNAENDISRIISMIDLHGDEIDDILLTADDHLPNDIAHPAFWIDINGKHPEPFTTISSQDIENKKYTTTAIEDKSIATQYIAQLEEAHKTHTIWPMHCIAGTWGAEIVPELISKLIGWTEGTNRHYQIIRKGWYPYTEHFGAFEAEVNYPMIESTLFNAPLARELKKYNHILIAGEAKSHCVKNTIKQILDKAPELTKQLVILTDAMSPVAGCDTLADDVIERAEKLGASISDTTSYFSKNNTQ
ncbi:MAG: isochorismatase family protein [Bacteroidales bacterium]|nr:isochorismatase family protein [Bacteroidales bacterium]